MLSADKAARSSGHRAAGASARASILNALAGCRRARSLAHLYVRRSGNNNKKTTWAAVSKFVNVQSDTLEPPEAAANNIYACSRTSATGGVNRRVVAAWEAARARRLESKRLALANRQTNFLLLLKALQLSSPARESWKCWQSPPSAASCRARARLNESTNERANGARCSPVTLHATCDGSRRQRSFLSS